MSRKLAVATLLYSADYLPGVLTLAHRLNNLLHENPVNNEIQTCLLVTKSLYHETLTGLARAVLNRLFSSIVEIDPLDDADVIKHNTDNLALLQRPELAFALTKMRLWEQTQYDQILYLDADTLPLKSEIFDLFSTLENQTSLQIAASPDIGWPDMFNSGVMMLIPDKMIATQLHEFTFNTISIDGADQGILNQFFNPICQDEEVIMNSQFHKQWITLSFLYNMTIPNDGYQCPPALKFFDSRIKLVHFIGKHKPWGVWARRNLNDNKFYQNWIGEYLAFQEENDLQELFGDLNIGTSESDMESMEREYEDNEPEDKNLPEDLVPYVASGTAMTTDVYDEAAAREDERKELERQRREIELEQAAKEPEPEPNYAPIDFKEWLSGFIASENQQPAPEYHEPPPPPPPQPEPQPQFEPERHEEVYVPPPEPQPEPHYEPEQGQEMPAAPAPAPAPEPAPVVVESWGPFRFDWENERDISKVERIFPGDVFENEVHVDSTDDEDEEEIEDVEDDEEEGEEADDEIEESDDEADEEGEEEEEEKEEEEEIEEADENQRDE